MRTLVVALETVNGAKGLSEASWARNEYPLAAIAGEDKLVTGVSKNPVTAIWEGEMDVASVRNDRATSVLILPWNLKDEIVQQMRHVGKWGARFIVPIPGVSIIDSDPFSHERRTLSCGWIGALANRGGG